MTSMIYPLDSYVFSVLERHGVESVCVPRTESRLDQARIRKPLVQIPKRTSHQFETSRIPYKKIIV